ncbi:MAG: class I SAM-dependent methyltransferase [Dehalococcoidia bacterium]
MHQLILDEATALEAWGTMVRANREQAERLRESPPGDDFYAPVASAFKADPHRTDEEALDALRSLVEPGDTWLDIGAGGGRYALPLALAASQVIAVEPSEGMRTILRESMAEHGIGNVSIVEKRWPAAGAPRADAVLLAHVGYDVEEIGPFLEAMEQAAGRICVAFLMGEAPASVAKGYWPRIHGEERALLPALPEFIALQLARGRLVDVRTVGARGRGFYPDVETAQRFLRQQLFIEPGGTKDERLHEILEASMTAEGIPVNARPVPIAMVTWQPREG